MGSAQPLSIEHIRVRPDRIELTVRVSHERYAQTTPALIEACLAFAPNLARHTCRNDVGPTFGSVMNNTSVPHLLEHLIVESQVRVAKDPSRIFVGTTEWVPEHRLQAKVAVSFEDDVVALAAITQALDFLNVTLQM